MDSPVKRSFASDLLAAGGRPSGFDYMRLTLAAAVVFMHSGLTSYGGAWDVYLWGSYLRPVMRTILPMFFVLSGFLVAGSLERCKTNVMFLGLRIIRIYPALAADVLLSALLIGPTVTVLPLRDYFTDPEFSHYLLNVTGNIHFALPGVFLTNPTPNTVNAQLWTVPYEIIAYLLLAAAAVAGIKKNPLVAPIVTVGLCVAHLGARLIIHDGHYIAMAGGIPGPLLIAYFLCGISFYLYRDRIRASARLALLSAIVGMATIAYLPLGEYVAILPIAYLTVSLGLGNPRRIALIKGADYSYGIYLYGFAIQQTVMFLFPALRVWWLNILVCLPLTALFAAFSWYCIERPALRLKPVVARLEVAWLKLRGKLPTPSWREMRFLRPSLEDQP
jgi:peptidoglycan/LPS O-acetylase OafA/YrhL